MRAFFVIAFVIAGTFIAMSETKDSSKKSPAESMRELRLKQLTTKPRDFGQNSTPEFPHVCAIVMDWPINSVIVTVVARSTGDASLYTTGTFGVIGGIGHETVRNAAKTCVRVGDKHFEHAASTKQYPYPKAGQIRFYLIGYDEVRVVDADEEAVRTGKDKCSELNAAMQHLVGELRSITEGRKENRQ